MRRDGCGSGLGEKKRELSYVPFLLAVFHIET